MRSAPHSFVLKNGSCAMKNREPCQVGNQAALSGAFYVPQGCLFGAKCAVNACKFASNLGCMIFSIDGIFFVSLFFCLNFR